MSFFEETFEQSEDVEPGRPPRKVWLVLAIIIVLAVAAFIALHEHAKGRLPLGAKVQGVSVGGMTVADARARLMRRLGPDAKRTLHFVHGGHTYSFAPVRSGVSVDYDGSLRRAGADSDRWSPGSLWTWLTSGDDVHPSLAVNKSRFDGALKSLAGRIGRPAVEGTVDFRNGHAKEVFGHPGLAVDQGRMRALVGRLMFDNHKAPLPIHRQSPYVSAAAVRAAYRHFARPAMSGPVVLDFNGHRVVAPPRLFGKALSMIPQQGKLVPLVNGKMLMKALKPVMKKTIGSKPRNARLVFRNGRPRVIPAVYGASYESDSIAAGLPAVLARRTHRVLHVHAAIMNPKRTTAQVKALGIRTRVSLAAVGEPSALAAKLNHTLVRAGDTLRLSKVIGAQSTPVASALFQAALRAGLTIPAHTTATTHDVKITPGQEMTDVSVRADPNAAFYVVAVSTGKSVTVQLWSTRDWRVGVRASKPTKLVAPKVAYDASSSCTSHPAVPGFQRAVTRWRRPLAGGPVQHETFRTAYKPVSGVSCGPSPTPTPTPTPTPGG